MPMYAMLTSLSPDAVTDPEAIEALGQRVTEKLNRECPEARWIASYAVLGPCDYLDLFEAPDNEAASKVSVVVRSFGHASTEIWPVTPWERFLDIVRTTSD
jgi:uncharacterized protein with GYD domain